MYHHLNKITGRLMASTHLHSPLFPVAPIALQRMEPPVIQYTAAQLSTVPESCPAPTQRRLMPGTNTPYPPLPEKIKKLQEQFQKDDGVPVHLKGGIFDVILYRLTMGLCLLSFALSLRTLYNFANPKKN